MKYFIIIICAFLLSGCSQDMQIQEDIKQINQNTQIPIRKNCSGTLSMQTKNDVLDWELNNNFIVKQKNLNHTIETKLYDHTIKQKIFLTGTIKQQISGNTIYHDFELHSESGNQRANTITEILKQTHASTNISELQKILQTIDSIQTKQRNKQGQNLQIDNTILARNPKKKFYMSTGEHNIQISKKKLEIQTNNNPSWQRTQDHKSNKININFHNQIDRQRQLIIQSTISKKQEQHRNIDATVKASPPKGDIFRRHDDILGKIEANIQCVTNLENK